MISNVCSFNLKKSQFYTNIMIFTEILILYAYKKKNLTSDYIDNR